MDEYRYSKPIGTPSKENILSVKYESKKTFVGGTVPVVNTISQLNNKITFVSLFNDKNDKNLIKKNIKNKVKVNLFYEKNFKEIYKTRFIDINKIQKFFEYYDFNNIEYSNSTLIKFLKKNLSKFDKVIICDFGHGLFNSELVNLIQKKSKFLCANIQTNSGNRGFNLFTKYSKLDLLCIDEPEVRLGLKERFLSIDKLIQSKSLNNYKNVIITRGIMGLIIRLNKSNKKIVKFPALNTKVVDTLGAGDAVYSYCSSLIKNTQNQKLISIVGSIAGAIKTNILGHSSNIQLEDVKRSLETLLK
jgi:bifunctional ADP-heptose synthase (sugar kinase/adenylyltransferase)